MTLFRKNVLMLLALLAAPFIYGQVNPDIQKGDRAFDRFDYQEAIYYYSIANDNSPGDALITRKIANTYRRMGQFNLSSEWYHSTLEIDSTHAEDMLFCAEALKNLGQYDEAIRWYEAYNRVKPGDIRAESHLSDKLYYRDYFADTARYKIKKLKINNDHPVIGISFFEGDKLLISAVNPDKKKTGESSPYLDVFACSMNDNNELENPEKLGKKVNSKYHDGPAFYSPSDNKLYITRSNIRNGKPVRDKKGNVNLKLYTSENAQGIWHSTQELKFNSDNYTTGHASVSKDGSTLYFVSTQEGGYGGSDIYQCFRTANGWSDPVNLGANINTPGNEMFPFIADNGTLYFASDGHAGLGGLDIFFAMRKAEIWQKPVNMGAPVNSTMDDFSIVFDYKNDFGFFCSNRSSMGDDDIYYYRLLKVEKMTIAGALKTKSPGVSLARQKIKVTHKNGGQVETILLTEDERFEVNLKAGDKIAVFMTDSNYFDTHHPILVYSAPAILEDPFVNIGSRDVTLSHEPDASGILADMKTTAFEEAAMRTPIETEEERLTRLALTELKGISTSIAMPMLDNSSLLTLSPGQRQLAYDEYMASGDSLSMVSQLESARSAYLKASALMPSDPLPTMKVIALDDKLRDENKTESDIQYDKLIEKADSLFANKLWSEALKYYSQAKSINAECVYPRMQINRIYRLMGQEEKTAETPSPIQTGKTANNNSALASNELDYIIFNYNSFAIRPEDIKKLDALVVLMRENPQSLLMVRTHCDSRGSLEYNQKLSMQRAKSIHNYLIKKGIAKDRLMAEWYGELRPLRRCVNGNECDESDHQINRRAEFKLVRL